MGNARWDNNDWVQYSTKTSRLNRDQIFKRDSIHEDLDPSKIKFRESVDSVANPNSNAILIGCDETGSMGYLAEQIIKRDLGTIVREIYDRQPISDPHIALMGIGDAYSDKAPLQVTQFEAGVEPLTSQIENIYLEANGGSNGGESYSLAWWFANYKVKSDAWLKRNRKGYLFTIGDECPHALITAEQIRKVMGVGCESDIPTAKLLEITQQYWHVFHLIVRPFSRQPVVRTWKDLLGEAAIVVNDTAFLAEGIVSTIQVLEGHNPDVVANSWNNKETALAVRSMVNKFVRVR